MRSPAMAGVSKTRVGFLALDSRVSVKGKETWARWDEHGRAVAEEGTP